MRSDGINAFDLSVFRSWQVREKARPQFRAEAYNALNHPAFANPNTTPASSAFGTVTATRCPSREVTFGLKYIFQIAKALGNQHGFKQIEFSGATGD